jgi:hypothetical protein
MDRVKPGGDKLKEGRALKPFFTIRAYRSLTIGASAARLGSMSLLSDAQ